MLVSRGNIRIKEYLEVTFKERENCCVFREGDGNIFTWKNYDINSIILLSNSYQGTFPCCVFREGDGNIFTWKNYDINSIILLSNSYQGTFPFCPGYLRLLTMF